MAKNHRNPAPQTQSNVLTSSLVNDPTPGRRFTATGHSSALYKSLLEAKPRSRTPFTAVPNATASFQGGTILLALPEPHVKKNYRGGGGIRLGWKRNPGGTGKNAAKAYSEIAVGQWVSWKFSGLTI